MEFSERDTPMSLVRFWKNNINGIFDEIDYCIEVVSEQNKERFRDYCPVPFFVPHLVLKCMYEPGIGEIFAPVHATKITPLAMWRKNKLVFDVDDALAAGFLSQTEALKDLIIPLDILKAKMPYPCIFIKTKVFGDQYKGCFFWIEYDSEKDKDELRMNLIQKSGDSDDSESCSYEVVKDGTIKDCMDESVENFSGYEAKMGIHVYDNIQNEYYQSYQNYMLFAISIILYIIQGSDVSENEIQKSIYKQPSGKPTDRFREVRKFDVGFHEDFSTKNSIEQKNFLMDLWRMQ